MILKHTSILFWIYLTITMTNVHAMSELNPKNSRTETHESKENTSSPNNQSHDKVESFSLMLSDTEQRVIEKAIKNDKSSPKPHENMCYFLGGILYIAPKNWTLWLNEQHYSNETTIPGVSVLNVTRDSVELKESTSKSRTGVILKINQTFCAHINYALSGDQRHTLP